MPHKAATTKKQTVSEDPRHVQAVQAYEAGLRALHEEDFARVHAPSEQRGERVQRERSPGEACVRGSAARAEREAPRVRQPRGEGARRGLRPLTAEVGLI